MIILSILTPYVFTIFIIRTSSRLLILPIGLVALIAIIISTTKFLKSIESTILKNIIRLGVIGMVLFFFISYGHLLSAADYIIFKLKEKRLNEFVNQIKKYNKIHEMTDGKGYHKTINDYLIELDKLEVDTIREFDKKFFLNDILKKEHLDKNKYEIFRQTLIDINLRSFTTLKDGTISFTIDGFLDNCR